MRPTHDARVLALLVLALTWPACRATPPPADARRDEADPGPSTNEASVASQPASATASAAQPPAPPSTSSATGDTSIPEAGAPDATTQAVVRLRFRTSHLETTHDKAGNERGSVELELLVDGGTPPRVPLGRRHAYGFSPVPTSTGELATVQSYIEAHGEYARVTRPRPSELRVEAFGQDEAFPDHIPPLTNVRRATVRIPADARVEVEEAVDSERGD